MTKVQKRVIKKVVLHYSYAIPIITLIILSTAFCTFCATSWLLTYYKGINIIHPYYASMGFIGAFGLFLTALSSIKYYKNIIKEEINKIEME
jgi:hypothetical protein